MTEAKSKREIPSGLKSVLEADIKLSKDFVEYVNKNYPVATYRSHLKSLEVRVDSEETFTYILDLRFPVMEFLGYSSVLLASTPSPAPFSLTSSLLSF